MTEEKMKIRIVEMTDAEKKIREGIYEKYGDDALEVGTKGNALLMALMDDL